MAAVRLIDDDAFDIGRCVHHTETFHGSMQKDASSRTMARPCRHSVANTTMRRDSSAYRRIRILRLTPARKQPIICFVRCFGALEWSKDESRNGP